MSVSKHIGKGRRLYIHENGTVSASDNRTWLPAVFDSERAARIGVDVDCETLSLLQKAAINRGGNRCVTVDDLLQAQKNKQ